MTQPPNNNWCIVWDGHVLSNSLSMDDLGEMLALNYHYSELSGQTGVSTSAGMLNFKIVSHQPCLYTSPCLNHHLSPYFANTFINVLA